MSVFNSLTKVGRQLVFKIDREQVDVIKRCMRGIRYFRKKDIWYVEATVSSYRNLMVYDPSINDRKDLDPSIVAWIASVKQLAVRLQNLQQDKVDSVSFPEGFVLPFPPFKHQQQAIAFGINLAKCALWLDLGLGKTYTSIMIARLRNHRKEVKKVLVLCPLSLIAQWKDEILKFSPPGSVEVLTANSSSGKARGEAIGQFCRVGKATENTTDWKMTYLVMTYESVSKYSPYLQNSFDMFILDEATKVKGPDSLRTVATSNLCNPISYGLELTGLAFLNNPLDLFSQFEILDSTVYGTDKEMFEKYYVSTYALAKSVRRGIDGFKKLDELKARAYYIAFSRNKADCFDLPPQVMVKRMLPITQVQAKYYDEIAGDLRRIQINEATINVDGTLPKLMKLQQLLCGFVIDMEGTPQWIGSPKYAEMVDIIQTSRDSFVVWGFHRCVLKKIKATLDSAGIQSVILSEESVANQEKYKKQFRNGDLKVAILQIQSESKGINMVSKKPVTTIYMESSLSVDDRYQSEGRTHRIGMTGTATYIDLLCTGTLDEQLYECMRRNIQISKYIGVYGMDMLLGKGGSVSRQKIRVSKLQKLEEEYAVNMDELRSLQGCGMEGLDDLIEPSQAQ